MCASSISRCSCRCWRGGAGDDGTLPPLYEQAPAHRHDLAMVIPPLTTFLKVVKSCHFGDVSAIMRLYPEIHSLLQSHSSARLTSIVDAFLIEDLPVSVMIAWLWSVRDFSAAAWQDEQLGRVFENIATRLMDRHGFKSVTISKLVGAASRAPTPHHEA